MAGSVGDGEFGFQIAPMLDILFVLLLFFMVSASAQKHEASLTTQLPGSGEPGSETPVRIGIDETGQVNYSGYDIDNINDHHLPQLVNRLKRVVANHATQPIVITPARATKQQRVIDVLNACAAANVKNLAFGSSAD